MRLPIRKSDQTRDAALSGTAQLLKERPQYSGIAVAEPGESVAELDTVTRGLNAGLLDKISTPVWIMTFQPLQLVWANRAGLQCWNVASLQELHNIALDRELSQTYCERLQFYRQQFEHAATTRFTDLWTLSPLGITRSLRVTISGYTLPAGETAICCEGYSDQFVMPESVRSAEALWHTPVMITLYDETGQALYRNPAATNSLAVKTCTLAERFADSNTFAEITETVKNNGNARLVTQIQTAAGPRWHEVTACRCFDPATGDYALLLSEFDISELKETEAKAHYLAHHDPLTGLPNRTQVNRSFQRRLTDCLQRNESAALLFIDLDRFKYVNDSLGHAFGDELLITVAHRLRSVLREGEDVARLGGDEFLVLICVPNDNPAIIDAIASRLHAVLTQPINVGGKELITTFSMGISRFPQDGTNLETLMQSADLAMYQAKKAGRSRSAYFQPHMTTAAQSRMDIETSLRQALEQNDFQLYFQPRLSVTTNAVVGAEALIRWIHREKGLISPAAFIPVCEETGLIIPLSNWVLKAACEQQRCWQNAGHQLSVSINVSARQFTDSNFLKTTEQIVAATGADPNNIELEITESLLVGKDSSTATTLDALVRMGFRIAIDDFGTGYSNLAYLHRYPISCLKIDRSFISFADTPRAIAEMIIAMGKLLKVTFVAEGVETTEQLAWLKTLNCHEYQGYLYSPPVPAQDFEKLLPEPSDTSRQPDSDRH